MQTGNANTSYSLLVFSIALYDAALDSNPKYFAQRYEQEAK